MRLCIKKNHGPCIALTFKKFNLVSRPAVAPHDLFYPLEPQILPPHFSLTYLLSAPCLDVMHTLSILASQDLLNPSTNETLFRRIRKPVFPPGLLVGWSRLSLVGFCLLVCAREYCLEPVGIQVWFGSCDAK